jgi:exopolyphosphatase/guanosine-5'-triphosphate,3'-diphosphate pyrophosphatase
MLFDALEPLHEMGAPEREMLCCAALLHDIGISVSYRGHHKHSLRLILESDLPALTADERELVANIARYHRKAMPKPKHRAFRLLSEKDQGLARRLAGILRMADGLDRAHENAVTRLRATQRGPGRWVVELYGRGDLAYAAWSGQRKAALFKDVHGVGIRFQPKGPPSSAS